MTEVERIKSQILTATFKGTTSGEQLTFDVTGIGNNLTVQFPENTTVVQVKLTHEKKDENKFVCIEISFPSKHGDKFRLNYTQMKNLINFVNLPLRNNNGIILIRDHPSQYEPWNIEITVNVMENIIVKKNELSSDLLKLLVDKKLTDFKFKVEGTEFKVHKSILAARSPVMMAEFNGEFKDGKIVETNSPNFTSEAFGDFLRYLYTDSLDDLHEHAVELLFLANYFQVEGLKEICEEKLLSTLDEKNAETIFQYAHLYNCKQILKEKSFAFIKSFFAKNNCILPDDFVNFPNEVIKAIESMKATENTLLLPEN